MNDYGSSSTNSSVESFQSPSATDPEFRERAGAKHFYKFMPQCGVLLEECYFDN